RRLSPWRRHSSCETLIASKRGSDPSRRIFFFRTPSSPRNCLANLIEAVVIYDTLYVQVDLLERNAAWLQAGEDCVAILQSLDAKVRKSVTRYPDVVVVCRTLFR